MNTKLNEYKMIELTNAWDTQDEMNFLDKLGVHVYKSETDEYCRLILLQKYIAAMKNRNKFGNIDKHKIQIYADYLYTKTLKNLLIG